MDELMIEPEADPNSVEDFAAHCAHDFNNLLTGILGNLELMENRARRNGVTLFDGYLEGARNAASRAAAFSQRLLAFSGRATQAPVRLSLHTQIMEFADLQRAQDIALNVELAPQDAELFCDPAALETALAELVGNAQEATAAQGSITLRTALAGRELVIAVQDTGSGMSEAVLALATTPFFSTRPNGAGKGLGLPIVLHFARDAGGRLTLESRPGSGTVAQLILPPAAAH